MEIETMIFKKKKKKPKDMFDIFVIMKMQTKLLPHHFTPTRITMTENKNGTAAFGIGKLEAPFIAGGNTEHHQNHFGESSLSSTYNHQMT